MNVPHDSLNDTKHEGDINLANKDIVIQNNDMIENFVMSCNDNSKKLPLINLKFSNHEVAALLDTGANLSLIQPSVLNKIKSTCKIQYISRAVKIHTINNSNIPYLSAVNIKFKIQNKWFENQFFVTKDDWQSNYKIILGYDFLQRNKILIDIVNKQLIINNDKFLFEESLPTIVNTNNSGPNEINNSYAKLVNNIILKPNSTQIIKLKVPKDFKNFDCVTLQPISPKFKYNINDSLHSISEGEYIFTIIENNSNSKIHLRKNTKLGILQNFSTDQIISPQEEEVYQINNLNLKQILQLRKEQLKTEDFDLEHLPPKEKEEILKMLMDNSQVFSKSYTTLGCTDKVVPQFKLFHNFPIQSRPFRIPKIAKEFAQKEISQLLEAGIIEESSSSYSFPVLFVKKKSQNGCNKQLNFRMVIDYRLLNHVTESFKIVLPKISEIIQNISGKKYFSVLDLKSAFFQIKLQEEDKDKLAFCCELGTYRPTRLFFGSKNSGSYFHTLISKCFNDLKGPYLQYFIDDIIIAANSIKEMKEMLQKVFERLKKFNLTLDPKKLQLCKEKITYLGFDINKDGFSPSEANIGKVVKLPIPRNVKQIQSLVGMTNYFRHLIFDYARIISPIVNLTRKNVPFVWSSECQKAFDTLQNLIIDKPALKNIDETKPFYLVCDASKISVCGILMQKYDDKFYPVHFFSKQLSDAESKYPSIRRELLAIFLSCKYFYEQLYGRKFTLLTDAKPLTHHLQLDKQPDIVARWLLYLQQFDFTMEHIPGKSNPADFLSRMTIDENLESNNINYDLENSEMQNLNSLVNTNDELHVNNIKHKPLIVNHIFEVNMNLSKENIKSCQESDSQIKEIKDKILANDVKTKNKYFIDSYSNLVMIKIKNKNKGNGLVSLSNKILIPSVLVREVLISAHSPHFGTEKTYEFVKRKYFWNGMFLDTKNFCESCEKCMASKPKPKNTVTRQIPKSHLAPGELISMDIVGKLPRSHDGHFFILTIIDHYSRFLEAIPLREIKSHNIIKCLNEYFARFGIPKVILSDNAMNFVSEEIENFLKSHNIEHRHSSIYYPQSNGTIERVHRFLKESITALSTKTFEWTDHLLFFKLHYNNASHSATGFPPAKIFLGRNLNIPLESFSTPKYVSDFKDYEKKITEDLKVVKKRIIENEQDYFEAQAKYVKGRKIPKLQLGDKVFVQEFKDLGTFQNKYNGPWTIVKIFRNDNYLLEKLENETILNKKVHISKIFLKRPLRPHLI